MCESKPSNDFRLKSSISSVKLTKLKLKNIVSRPAQKYNRMQ